MLWNDSKVCKYAALLVSEMRVPVGESVQENGILILKQKLRMHLLDFKQLSFILLNQT